MGFSGKMGTMTGIWLKRVGVVCVMGVVVATTGCHRKRKTKSAPKSEAYADAIKPIVASKHLQAMHWPDFADYGPLVETFYDDRNYEVAWVDGNGKPSVQASAFIQLFRDAAKKGLNADDYDAGLWEGRAQRLSSKKDEDVATFDSAMTVSVMRYISDLRIGRVNPTHFNFDIDTQNKKYNLPEYLSDNAVDAGDVPALVRSVEPDSEPYGKLETALGHYLDLARVQAGRSDLQQALPTVAKAVTPGGQYGSADALVARLQLEGDLEGGDVSAPAIKPSVSPAQTVGTALLPVGTGARLSAAFKAGTAKLAGGGKRGTKDKIPVPSTPPVVTPPVSMDYTQEIAEGVRHYQARHGLTADGRLTVLTITSLNVPMTKRVQQMDDTLERWRWLPNEYVNPALMVNLPEFVLRGYSVDHARAFTMKVVVGKVVGDHDTPVFTHLMKYVIFRPFWNVPQSIIKKELAGHIQKSGIGYLASKNFETVDAKGNPVKATVQQVEHGGVVVREKPGPKNSLGLIKFMFPNEYDIYMHSTPQPELFEHSRRDFSHGCVRVQKPADLAVWVLGRGKAEPADWDIAKVNEAMLTGVDNHQVNLKQTLPVAIFYMTANIGDDGQTAFFDDLYGYDKKLEDVLAKGRPFPSQQVKVNPNALATPGDTD